MLERLLGIRKRLGFAELMIVGVVLLTFVIGGVVGGTPVRILHVCSGLAQSACEASDDNYMALNPAAGLLAAAGFVIVLIVIDRVMRLRAR